ncbi:hypothetical protein O5626_28810, partial [Escherichia coli]|nr:hypothetical protein [Escherichia coli]
YQSVECRRCQDSCEPMAIIFRPTLSGIYQPQLNSQLCNGCGACALSGQRPESRRPACCYRFPEGGYHWCTVPEHRVQG